MHIEGIGELLPWAEFWKLIYDDCGHEQMFPRTQWNYGQDQDQVETEVRKYYAACDQRARPCPRRLN